MAPRQQDSHYDAPSKNPPVGSDFEFYWHGFAVLDEDLHLPTWWRPIPVPDHPDVARMIRRTNYALVLNEVAVEIGFVRDLRALGVPEECLVRPYNATMAGLLERLIDAEAGRRSMQHGGSVTDQILALRDEYARRDLELPAYRRELTVRVILSAQMALKENRPKQLCAFLNAGLPVDGNGNGIEGLGRHAHRSAWRTFRQELKVEGNARLERLGRDIENFKALRECREQARTSKKFPHLRSLKGAALIRAMHSSADLRDGVFRTQQHRYALVRQKSG